MAHHPTTGPQETHHDAHGSHGAHPVEDTPETKAERAASRAMTDRMIGAIDRPAGLALALVGAGLALGVLGFIGDDDHPYRWTWSIVAAFVACYGLALIGASKGQGRIGDGVPGESPSAH